MVSFPADNPLKIPEELPIVATAVFKLVHTPPNVSFVKVIAWVAQTAGSPAMVSIKGVGLTFNNADTESVQPKLLVTIYFTVVVSTVCPDTNPVFVIDAINGLAVSQIPPVESFVN